jgi:hypothetical protein
MLGYLIIFSVIGAGIKHFIPNEKVAIFLIVFFSLLWGMTHAAIWGFVTLGELFLGYFVYSLLKPNKQE